MVTTTISPSTTSNQSSEVIKFAIDGMTCAACAARATRVLRRVPGVLEASVNFALERGQARIAKDEVSSNQLSDVIHKAGFEFSLIPNQHVRGPKNGGLLQKSSCVATNSNFA